MPTIAFDVVSNGTQISEVPFSIVLASFGAHQRGESFAVFCRNCSVNALANAAVRALAREHGLSTAGARTKLIARLTAALGAEGLLNAANAALSLTPHTLLATVWEHPKWAFRIARDLVGDNECSACVASFSLTHQCNAHVQCCHG